MRMRILCAVGELMPSDGINDDGSLMRVVAILIL